MDLHLIVGDKNYSSWSMRPWVAMTAAGVPFRESKIKLDTPTALDEKLRWSPAGRVPILIAGEHVIWDSLAICEFVAERFPDRSLWPADPLDRARARSLCSEMHAGFLALRTELPMNHRRQQALRDGPSPAARADLTRVAQIFAGAREPFLLGPFGIADAFYAPIAARCRSYEIALDGAARAYAERLLAQPAVTAWVDAGRAETHPLPKYDAIR